MRIRKSVLRGGLFAAAVAGGVEFARAATVTVVNPSFEADVLNGPGGANNFSTSLTGWTGSGPFFGALKPSTGVGGIFPAGVPDGVNVAYIGASGVGASIQQTLAATVQASFKYTLMYDIGQRPDIPNSGFEVEVDAGGNQIGLSTGAAAAVPPAGTFLPETLSFSTGAAPAELGDAITIKFIYPGTGSQFEPAQVIVDNVSFDASPLSPTSPPPVSPPPVSPPPVGPPPPPSAVPLPAGAWMGLTAIAPMMAAYWRRRRSEA